MGISAAEPHDVLSSIIKKKTVTLEEVLILRRQVWPDGKLSKSETEMLFRMHKAIEYGCAEWDDFLVESLTAYLVDQAHPEGYVSEADAGWLEQHILHEGKLRGAAELEALVTILERAVHVPHRLEMLALETVRDAIADGNKTITANLSLEKGIISDPEVSLLRRVIYAKSGSRSDAISLDEATLVYDLNRTIDRGVKCPAWTMLFVNVISNYLLDQNGYVTPTRDRLREIDSWLNRPSSGVIGFASAVALRNLPETRSAGEFADIKSAFGNLSPLDDAYTLRNNDKSDGAARVDSLEARWLINHLCREGLLTLNERALLVFLKTGDYAVDPALNSLIARAQ